MPELPEVETTARLLRPRLLDRQVHGVRVPWRGSLGGQSPQAMGRALRGTRIRRVDRRGKYVVIDLSRGPSPAGSLLVHLRMTGRLFVVPSGDAPGPYVRVSLELDERRRLDFEDVRKFGRFGHVADAEEALAHLGPEPLGPAFTTRWFQTALRHRRRQIKPLLLDQTFLAGLGNIYTDESLFRARIHPLRRADTVRRPQAEALHAAIRTILAEAIEREGSSFDGFYRTPEGRAGSYQERFSVYGRNGAPCPRCGRAIARLVVGQRGTHICRWCQRPPRPPRP